MSNAANTIATNGPVKEWYPLWINDDWYIRVDAEGRCTGKCGEGALGFIVQLSSQRDSKAVRALKIPRLVAETDRENAYIGELLAQELSAVRNVFDRPGSRTGLVGALDTSSPFQKTLRIERLEEAMEWNGSLLFVRFEKGQNPYFCLVKQDGSQAYPPKTLAPKIDSTLYEHIRDVSRTSSTVWSQMVFVSQALPTTASANPTKNQTTIVQQNDTPAIFNAMKALSPEQTTARKIWYTCIPSVIYEWAPNTLQEAIGRGDRGGTWSIDKHLELVEQVCEGIKVLHNKGMLHADIRPANIVYLGDARDPSKYVLSDYGSFAYSNAQPLQVDGQQSPNGTVPGPVLEGERVSPFYAPERGSSRERETADMALVISSGAGPYCHVIVGWQSEFINLGLLNEVSDPKMSANEYLDFIVQRRSQYGSETFEHSLAPGDRVQLRDYVFELTTQEEVLGNILVFTCDQKFWTVYNGRIAIYENRSRQSCFAFTIPRIVELPQWSAATDLFSLGVLCLYSVYAELLAQPTTLPSSDSDPTQTEKNIESTSSEPDITVEGVSANTPVRFGNQKPEQTPTTQTNSKSSTVKLDEDFEIMLKYLADKSLFNAVWPQLEWLRKQIEEKLDDQQRQYWTADRLAQHTYETKEELEVHRNQEALISASGQSDERTLQNETIKVISQITSTVPGIEHLLRPLSRQQGDAAEYQLRPFIFFLQFVLCCLHRQSSMDEEKRAWVQDGWMTVPFCENRHDKPINGAADRALERLKTIRSILKAGGLNGLIAEKNKIAPFDLRPENAIRADNRRLKEEKQTWVGTQDMLTQKTEKLQQVEGENKQYQQLVQELERSFNEAIKKVEKVQALKIFPGRQTLLDEMTKLFVEARKVNSVKRDAP